MFVKKGNGVVSTQMWEGEVHTCNLPAQEVPGAGSPSYPRCCVSTQSHPLAGSLSTRTMVTSSGGWSGKTLSGNSSKLLCPAQAPLLE